MICPIMKQESIKMMKNKFKLLLFSFLFNTSFFCSGQSWKPQEVSISYFGEMITHPGIKLSASYQIKQWRQFKTQKKGASQEIFKSIQLSPSLAYYYHRRYHHGLQFVPELFYRRKKENGTYLDLGIGIGVLRTIIPEVYTINEEGRVEKSKVGYSYFKTSLFAAFGKDFFHSQKKVFTGFIKPQFQYSIPGFPNGTGYFFLEAGLLFPLKSEL